MTTTVGASPAKRTTLLLLVAACFVLLLAVSLAPVAPDDRVLALYGAATTLSETTPGSWPVLMQERDVWWQPLAVQPAALLLKLGVPAEAALRVPPAAVALLSVLTTFLLVSRLTSPVIAGWAALLLALTPGFLELARRPGADLLVVPAVTLWLACIAEHTRRPRRWLPAAGALGLTMAAYAQPAGVLAVPLYFAMGAVVLLALRRDSRAIVAAGLVVAVGLLPFGLFLWRFPDTYPETFGRWAIHAAHIRDPWDGIVAFTRWHVLARRVGIFWDYLNPSFLFLSGRLLAVAAVILMAAGLWRGRALIGSVWHGVTIVGVLTALLSAVLLDSTRSTAFTAALLPFAAVLAALGGHVLLNNRRLPLRWAGAIAIGLLALQLTLISK